MKLDFITILKYVIYSNTQLSYIYKILKMEVIIFVLIEKVGTVYWLTGLSGSGKTTIGKLLNEKLKEIKPNVVFLDGDILRDIFGNDLGHSVEERRKSAMRNSCLCKALADQGIDVVCSTISLFHSCQNWNRSHIKNYKEIYLKVPMEILIKREKNGLYTKALQGQLNNVVGVDIKPEVPVNPDLVIENNGKLSQESIVTYIFDNLYISEQ